MMIPALPELVAQTGSAGVAAGSLVGAYGLSRLLCNALSGILADWVGVAKSALLGLLLLASASAAGFFAGNFAALFAVMAMLGAATSVFSTAAMTALVLNAGPRGRGRALVWFQTALLLGLAMGPVVGGDLVERLGPRAPFPTQSAIALLALLVTPRFPKSPSAPRSNGTLFRSLGSLIGPALLVGGLGGFASFFSRFGLAWNLVPLIALQQFHLSAGTLGWIIGAGTLTNLIVMPVLGRLVDTWGAAPTFITACLLNLVGLLALWLAPGVTMLWVSTAIVMLATGVMLPAAGALALSDAEPQMVGRTMGLYRTIGESGMALGPVVVPVITAAGSWSLLSGLLTCSVITVVALLATMGFRLRLRTAV